MSNWLDGRMGLLFMTASRSTKVSGTAHDDRETFEFTIEPFVSGGFLLTIRYSGDQRSNVTGAGIWPSVEKAKTVAEETAARLLHGADVAWT